VRSGLLFFQVDGGLRHEPLETLCELALPVPRQVAECKAKGIHHILLSGYIFLLRNEINCASDVLLIP
jgi:hypothetical protein